MDWTLGMDEANRCQACGSDELEEDEFGGMSCAICGTQSQVVLQEVYDADEGAEMHWAKRIRGEKQESSKPTVQVRTCLRAYQLVLRGGAHALIEKCGCPPVFMNVMENVWFEFLTRFKEFSRYPIIQCFSSKLRHLSIKAWKKEEQEIRKRKRMKKLREMQKAHKMKGLTLQKADFPDIDSEPEDYPFKQEEAFLPKNRKRQEISDSNITPKESNQQSESDDNSKSDSNSDQERDSTGNVKIEVTTSERPNLDNHNNLEKEDYVISVGERVKIDGILVLAIWYFCCRWLRTGIVPQDLIRWVTCGELPYLNVVESFPESLLNELYEAYDFFKFNFIPKIDDIVMSMQTFAVSVGRLIPPMNIPLVGFRFIEGLGFPKAVAVNFSGLLGISKVYAPNSSLYPTATPVTPLKSFESVDGEFEVMAWVIVACKMCPDWREWFYINASVGNNKPYRYCVPSTPQELMDLNRNGFDSYMEYCDEILFKSATGKSINQTNKDFVEQLRGVKTMYENSELQSDTTEYQRNNIKQRVIFGYEDPFVEVLRKLPSNKRPPNLEQGSNNSDEVTYVIYDSRTDMFGLRDCESKALTEYCAAYIGARVMVIESVLDEIEKTYLSRLFRK